MAQHLDVLLDETSRNLLIPPGDIGAELLNEMHLAVCEVGTPAKVNNGYIADIGVHDEGEAEADKFELRGRLKIGCYGEKMLGLNLENAE
jgi:hypothetical protein